MKKIYLIFCALAFCCASASFANDSLTTCPIGMANIEARVRWVLDPAHKLYENPYYQKCLKGDNSFEAVKKFIDCMENPEHCRISKEAGYCEGYCKDAEDKTVVSP
ncbi:MAG TPA: hypothetical protein VEL47_00230 [Myxococcota bacterium]|nr:hypothetical protein [Myxococcota bacterium]